MQTGWSTIVSHLLDANVGNEYLANTLTTELNNWLINAFNGEWLRMEDAVPKEKIGASSVTR